MHNGEWSLISFTLLSQLSVGLVLALGFVFFMHHSIFENLGSGLSFRAPEFIILILILAATLLSLLHLGSPLHSYHSLNNLKGSWISREILMLSIFGLGMLLFLISRMFAWPMIFIQVLLVFSMLSGVVLVLSMAGIYLIPTVPAWNSFYTPTSFLGSALLLGSVGMIVFVSQSNPSDISLTLQKQMLLFVLIIIGISILVAAFNQYQLIQFKFTGIDQVTFNEGFYLMLFIVRMVILIIVFLGIIYLLKRAFPLGNQLLPLQAYYFIMVSLIFIEQVIGRYQFYESYFRLGV